MAKIKKSFKALNIQERTIKYQAHIEQEKALKRIAKRGNIRKLDRNKPLLTYVITKLKAGWIPEQITLRLPIDWETDTNMRISYEAIYQYIYSKVDRGSGQVKALELDLRQYLARKHTRRRKKGFRQAMKLARSIALPSIEDRPKEVKERTLAKSKTMRSLWLSI
jgi:IS30 family transposase